MTEPLMLLPTRLLTLLPTVCHSPTPSTSLRILLPTSFTIHLPIDLLTMLHIFSHNLLLYLNQLCPDLRFTLPASTNGRDLYDDHRLREMEVAHGRLEGIFGGVATAAAGNRDGFHAFIVVLVCDEGENVDEGFIEAFALLCGF